MFKPSHLTDEGANVLAGAIDERVYFIQSKRWIAYPKAVHILDHLNKLLKHPRTTRMPSLIVYGDSGMGKSMLVDKFKADCAAGCATDSTRNPNKVLVVELSGRPTERRLFSQILAAVDESWSRLSGQDSAKVKWTAAGVCPLQFLALGVTEGGRSPTGDTSSATRKFMPPPRGATG